jgi:hypothetical protein
MGPTLVARELSLLSKDRGRTGNECPRLHSAAGMFSRAPSPAAEANFPGRRVLIAHVFAARKSIYREKAFGVATRATWERFSTAQIERPRFGGRLTQKVTLYHQKIIKNSCRLSAGRYILYLERLKRKQPASERGESFFLK